MFEFRFAIEKFSYRTKDDLTRLLFEATDMQFTSWAGERKATYCEVDDPIKCMCNNNCADLTCPTLEGLGVARLQVYGECINAPVDDIKHGCTQRVCTSKPPWGSKSRIQRQMAIDYREGVSNRACPDFYSAALSVFIRCRCVGVKSKNEGGKGKQITNSHLT